MEVKMSSDFEDIKSGGRNGSVPCEPSPLSPFIAKSPSPSTTKHYTAGQRQQQQRQRDEAIQAIAEYGKNVQLALDQHSRDILAHAQRMTEQNDQIMEQNHRIEEHSEFLLTLHHVQLNTQVLVAKLGQDVRETRTELREVKRQVARIEERQQKSRARTTEFQHTRNSDAGTKRRGLREVKCNFCQIKLRSSLKRHQLHTRKCRQKQEQLRNQNLVRRNSQQS